MERLPVEVASATARLRVATGAVREPTFASLPRVETKIATLASPSMPSQFVSSKVSSGESTDEAQTHWLLEPHRWSLPQARPTPHEAIVPPQPSSKFTP